MSGSARFSVVLKRSAAKELDALDAALRGRVLDILAQLGENPWPPGARKVSGPYGLWRVRTGDYRILYKVEDDVLKVYVVRIAHCGQVYRRLDALV